MLHGLTVIANDQLDSPLLAILGDVLLDFVVGVKMKSGFGCQQVPHFGTLFDFHFSRFLGQLGFHLTVFFGVLVVLIQVFCLGHELLLKLLGA